MAYAVPPFFLNLNNLKPTTNVKNKKKNEN